MQQTTETNAETAREITARAKHHAERLSGRLLHLFSFVPDDKLTFTPSPTSRSSLRIVAHCALVNAFLADVITDKVGANAPSPEAFFKNLHDAEAAFTTRESAVALLEENTATLCRAIDTVNAESVGAERNSPFGPLPMPFWMFLGGDQMAGHAGQMEYLQTIWGDGDNHLG